MERGDARLEKKGPDREVDSNLELDLDLDAAQR